jgi:PAS domain S-box-containing protein
MNLAKNIIDSLPEEIVILDRERNIILANKAFLEKHKTTHAKAKGKKCFSYFHKPGRRWNGCLLEETVTEGLPKRFEVHDGKSDRHVEISTIPVLEKGTVRYVIHVAKDITKKKDRESEVRKLNRELLMLYATSARLQRTSQLAKKVETIIGAFLSLGYDRVRVYLMRRGRLYGYMSSYLDKEVFGKVSFELNKEHPKAVEAMRRRRPVILKERKTRYTAVLEKEGLLESATLPMMTANRAIGLISLDNKHSARKIGTKDLDNLMTFANQAAAAIENAQLVEENRRKLEVLGSLYDISSAFAATLDLQKVMSIIAARSVRLFDADMTVVYLISERKDILQPHSFFSKDGRLVSLQGIKPDKENCLKTGKPHLYQTEQHGMKSLLAMPIMIENTPTGVIHVFSRKERRFDDEDLSTLYSLSNQAAIIIENSRLYDRIRDDKEQLSKLIGFSESINSTLEKEKLLETVLHKSKEFTGADSGILQVMKEPSLKISTDRMDDQVYEACRKLTSQIMITRRPLIVNEHRDLSPEVASVAAVPIILKDEAIGVLHLFSGKKDSFKKFRKSLEILMNHIASAIENSRMYEEISRFNAKLKEEVEQATRELRDANIELRKMDLLKSDFVSNVSHELRTPLTSIMGYTKLMLKGKLGELEDRQRQSLAIIESEAERLTRLINEILDLSKLESGKMPINLVRTDIVEIAADAIRMLESQAMEKSIKLRLRAGRLPRIMASEDLIKQVFINLIGNAVKFTPAEGRVTVSLRRVGKEIRTEVADTGVGIPAEALPKLFSKFYQVDSSTTRHHSGTGLGLVIAKHIINQHEGRIEVESELGKGSRFTFFLPAG